MIDQRLVAFVRDPKFWRTFLPDLGVGARTSPVAARAVDPAALERAMRQIREDGFLKIEGLARGEELDHTRYAIEKLCAQGWPPVFVFMYDEPWVLLASMRVLLEAFLDKGYRSLAGFWAWDIAPNATAGGWSPHRDRWSPTVREDGTLEMLTLWIALTDATPENGCMYFLPAPRDPNYKTDLSSVAVPDPQDVRALTAEVGTVLGWTQQLLHWGGRSSAWAPAPRISLSMEFRRDGFPLGEEAIPDEVPPFEERVRLVGKQIRHYAHMEPPSRGLAAIAEAIDVGPSASTSG